MVQLKLTEMSTEEQITLLHFAYPALFKDQVSPATLEMLKLDFLEDRLAQIQKAYQHSDNETVETYISEVRALADNPLLPRYITALIGSYEGGIDGLTRLRNRAMYQSDLQTEVARAFRGENIPDLSLALIDIDYLKRINDTNGHPFADEVIKSIAGLIKESLRTSDTAYRIGGDEFAVILPGSTEDNASNVVAERILDGAGNLMIENRPYPVGLSIGTAQLRAGDSAAELYQHADKVLYRAKNGGRNRIAAESGLIIITESCPVYREN